MSIVTSEPPIEYFRELVEGALVRQHVTAQDLTAFYLVNLLTGFLRTPESNSEAVIDRAVSVGLLKALQSGGSVQRHSLRRVGDLTLMVAGFFADSLTHKLVDVDYYTAIGSRAYGALGEHDPVFPDVFAELACKFVAFSDVLAEVSERSCITSSSEDTLRVYEKWLKTRSKRSAALLCELGIVPNMSILKTVQ